MIEFLKSHFGSRKFRLVFTAVAGIVSSVLAGAITPDAALYSIVVLVLGLVVSIAWEDVSKRGDIFEKAQQQIERVDWLIDEAGELLTVVEEQAGTIEKD